MSIEVRKARLADIPRLIPMMNDCFEESEFAKTFGFTSKEDDTMRWFAGIVPLREYGFFVAENSKGPAGFLVVGIRPWVMNFNEVYAFELFYYVDKKYRDGSVSKRLIKAYEEWAKEMGCRAVEFGSTDAMKGRKMGRFLERLGYAPALRSHVKKLEVQDGNG